MKNHQNKMHTDLMQCNQSGTKVRFPSVIGEFRVGDLVKVPTGQTLEVGRRLLGSKRELLLSYKKGGVEVWPIAANVNIFK